MSQSKLDKLRLPYELTMISLAITVAVLVVREILLPLTDDQLHVYRLVDWTVLTIFAIRLLHPPLP
jgi:hypothetical protein